MEVYKEIENLPEYLQQIPDYPKGLYCYGDVTRLNGRCISVVGARNPTKETLMILPTIIKALVQEGYTIVSGCAVGVDSYVHQLTHQMGGKCIGVLGYGIQYRYPKTSAAMIDTFCKQQLIVSEYAPQTRIQKFQFIARNRLIAGLSQATIIVQAREKSGSLITGQMALEYNRDVFVVPGQPFCDAYKGSHQLLSEGAQILYTSEQLEKKSGLFR